MTATPSANSDRATATAQKSTARRSRDSAISATMAWIAPAFDGQTQVAVIGINSHKSKLDYSTGDLDLLAEVAEHVGKIVLDVGTR